MIPRNLLYNKKVESSSSRSWKANIQPQNGTGNYNASDVITINIPTGPNLTTVMSENYLKFDAVFTSSGANDYLRWDSCGAHGLINRIRISHGSNLLEDIEDYGALAKMLFDLQVQTSGAYGKYNIMAGTRSDLVTNVSSIAAAGKHITYQVNSGDRILEAPPTLAAIAAGTITRTYCLNLFSLCGSLCAEKYFPLFKCKSSPLKVEIFLQPSIVNAIASKTAATTFQLKNVEYIANMIELSDSAIQTIESSLNGNPLTLVIPEFRTFITSGQVVSGGGASSSFSIPIAAKYASLKSLIVMIRSSALPAIEYFPYDSRHFNLSQYTFRIGSKTVPSKAIDTYPEMFCEVVKCIGSISDLRYNPSIESFSYAGTQQKSKTLAAAADSVTSGASPGKNDDAAASVGFYNSGSFYVGLDVESYTNADKSQIFSGYNSNNDDIFFNPTFLGITGTAAGDSNTLRFNTFANFDCTIVFENDTCYAAF